MGTVCTDSLSTLGMRSWILLVCLLMAMVMLTGAMPKKSKKDKSSSSEGDNRKLKSGSDSSSSSATDESKDESGDDEGENRYFRCIGPWCPGDLPPPWRK